MIIITLIKSIHNDSTTTTTTNNNNTNTHTNHTSSNSNSRPRSSSTTRSWARPCGRGATRWRARSGPPVAFI